MFIVGGLYKCIEEAVRIGARSCGLFLKSQRQWASKPLTEDTIQMFKDTIQKHNFPVDKLLPHGSYLINCGSPDDQTLQKSRTALIDELQRCELLGIPLYNFHPGSSCGKISREECMDKISESINLAHSQTNNVITVIENMSCQGNTIGGKLEELKCIIDRVKDKSRIGVCIDTCHAFAAGYDVSTESGFNLFMQQLDDIVGLQYLKAVHLNDSKGKLGCHLDRHENIGKGHIGIEGFKLVMREPNFDNLPMILETPMELSDEEEIKILNSM
ncbi:hypothetical protein LOTGIDRAFT_210318 [Lottia gigantea]|uniref:Xylose isomerase-like TIM barrel domain-containing protein n=1 Tax=Lottia gigantea TaxID=225164 RepID=V3ZXY3_LOTGI|nr:hypothetical protein LOTGIDRAFT_210318 [Lottia gigantea]ESO89277.1 hypothetical protein LOTGIDRAFT_210318 [Lottia gigantea]